MLLLLAVQRGRLSLVLEWVHTAIGVAHESSGKARFSHKVTVDHV